MVKGAAQLGRGVAAAVAGAAGAYAAGYGLIRAEGAFARQVVGQRMGKSAPDDDGRYGSAPGEPIELIILGDSSAAGLGATQGNQTIGAIIASGIAAISGQSVELINEAVIGARSADLNGQLEKALARADHPQVALILIGANDVSNQVPKALAAHQLGQTVHYLRALDVEVVVGTCPDMGTVRPIPYPLKNLMRSWSRALAAEQTLEVVAAGGRTVSLADLLGPEFSASPAVMFSDDRFHPSAAGYARCASALLPSVAACLGLQIGDARPRSPEKERGEGIKRVYQAATQAAAQAGVEVAPTQATDGAPTRPTWASLLRRRQFTPRGEATDEVDPPIDHQRAATKSANPA